MKFCPRCGCETNEHTPTNVVKEWKEKAQKYDDLMVNTEWSKYVEDREKAKKWDEHFLLVEEWREKAQKWDSLWDKMEQVSSTMTPEDMIVWREKASILDRFTKACNYQSMKFDDLMVIKSLADRQSEDISARMSTHPYVNVPTSEYERLQDKAKKWDVFSSDIVILGPDSSTAQIAEIHEWKEKAQKWDDVCSNNHPTKTLLLTERYLEYKEKVQKWDDYVNTRTDGVSSDLFDEYKEKARKYDEIASYSSYYTKIEKIKKIIED